MKSGVCSCNGTSAYMHDVMYKIDTTFCVKRMQNIFMRSQSKVDTVAGLYTLSGMKRKMNHTDYFDAVGK